MKKITIILCMLFTVFISMFSVDASEKVTVYIFTKADEPICDKTIEYFKTLHKEFNKYFEYEEYQVWDAQWKEDSFNRELAERVAQKFNDEIIGAPYIVIGSNYRFDEYSEELNDEIKDAILAEYDNENYSDLVKRTSIDLKDERSKEGIYTGAILIGVSTLLITIILLARKANKKNKD
ncbi:MAG: hypothetical protein E7167_05485 [Firmicutes bacterium]|nr:hypothetical protein [Bacillota bacterium]